MSRSGYSDDVDGWALVRWRGAVAAALRGVRGQETLHGLAAALDAMPLKKLTAGRLIQEDGSVCALGALGIACGNTEDMQKVDPEDCEQVAQLFGIAEALAREIQDINDEYSCGETAEMRWKRMRAWVEANIQR